ncbi:hypothetical protein ACRASX_12415 [Flavobacterium sp. TMP13]|uniref:hypothetical protein n=1 Tax=unclassified Flavobacterium TaxID=196869 RepID=UPI00076C1E4C|nr:hypothetical protein [Flavobacterium sp. TAB 87]KVV16175.1 hypothetical protein AP058_00340 [Flavobacterium sp. TAB 87]
MKNECNDKTLKKNQPTKLKSSNPDFPQEYEEQENSALRMKSQPLEKDKKS